MMASESELNHIGYFITLISRKNDFAARSERL